MNILRAPYHCGICSVRFSAVRDTGENDRGWNVVYGISFHHMADAVRVPAASDTGNPGSVHGLSAAEEGECCKYNQPGDLMAAIRTGISKGYK